ncbi:putative inorganic phosphate cotransporter [Armadillidium nasatum]|uniref:Putative inorganic phosphate cotransporter n=1 Tax=Armadillidium nasatum TaxID=96803 RepID=A0A5N5ST40_9CRUS|nr:putative inorganic phosphate cotransporter [Armadillidium nasatum]
MLVSPFAARISPSFFIAIRILLGITSGLGFPAMTSLIAKWYPRNERSKFAAFILSSNQLGTVVSMGISGWLCGSEYLGGWPSVFYLFGSLGLLWGVFWFILITENPASHPRISDQELKYIIKGCPPITEKIPVPWSSLLSSKPYWCVVIGHFGIAWSTITLLTELPTYLHNILHVKIENNGILSALPFLGAWIFSMVLSLSLNTLVVKKVITLLSMRKISMVFGAIILCFTNCNKTLALSVFVILGTGLGGQFPGVLNSHADITPRFAGTAIGLANALACAPGLLSPLIVSYLTDENVRIFICFKIGY